MSGGGQNPKPVQCRKAQWTQVVYVAGNLVWPVTYTIRAPAGVHVDWKWLSAGVPPYWAGSFSGGATITLPPGAYTSLDVNPNADCTVYVYS